MGIPTEQNKTEYVLIAPFFVFLFITCFACLFVLFWTFESFCFYFCFILNSENCVGAGAFGEVFIADAIGITTFDPRYKISAKHKPLLGKKRFSLSKSKNLSREDSVASSRSSRSTKSLVSKSGGDKNAVVAVKKLKGRFDYFTILYFETQDGNCPSIWWNSCSNLYFTLWTSTMPFVLDDASSTEYKDLISELKILIHIGQNKHIVNLLAACTKGENTSWLICHCHRLW